MDCLMLGLLQCFCILFFNVVPASAVYYNYYYYYYYSYYYYSSGLSLSAGSIAGAVIGSIVGLVIIIVIIAALCGAFKGSGRRGTVVHPVNTTSTVVSTNISHSQPTNVQHYNQYPQSSGGVHPQPQNMTYPPK